MPAALVGVVSRNRRRYGGYIVHVGVAVLLIGIAASSSFQTNRDVELRPGQSTVVDGRKVTYVRPTASVDRRAFTSGALLRVEEGRQDVHPAPDPPLLPPDRAGATATIASYFDGESDSEVGPQGRPRERLLDRRAADITAVQAPAPGKPTKASRRASGGAPGTPPQCDAVGGADARRRRQPRACSARALAQIDQAAGADRGGSPAAT